MSDLDARRGSRQDVRARLVEVAARLLAERGPAGVTTRAVAEAAGMQAPAIYRLFGDKDGLLEAVAEHVLATYVAAKSAVVASADAADVDPVADLRAGWDTHVAFGLAHPALFGLLHGPGRAADSPAAAAGLAVLRARVHRVAAAGRLRVSERHAVAVVHAAGTGAVLTLLATPPGERDLGVADTLWCAVARAVLTDAPAPAGADPTVSTAAVQLRAGAAGLPGLTAAERTLLGEWLDRVVSAAAQGG